jgi:osmoprotectant transport system permease protein
MDVLADALAWLTDSANYGGDTGIPARVMGHVLISVQSTAVAALMAIPLGLYVGHTRKLEFISVSGSNLGRALPSFGVLGLVFPFTLDLPGEFGYWATFLAMFLLAIPPLVTNTYVGIKEVDQDAVEAARGMGMTEREVLLSLEIPLASPLIVSGLRIALVQVVATATLGAWTGWQQGLGSFVRDGIAQGDLPQVVGGAILVALLAIVAEMTLGVVGRLVAPRQMSPAHGARLVRLRTAPRAPI